MKNTRTKKKKAYFNFEVYVRIRPLQSYELSSRIDSALNQFQFESPMQAHLLKFKKKQKR